MSETRGNRPAGRRKAFFLSATALVLVCGAWPAAAQTALDTAAGRAPTAATLTNFDIPAGDIGPALTNWAAQSHVRLVASTDALKGVKTDGVKGVYAPEEALDRLLSNTELRSNFAGKRTVTILSPSSLDANAQAALPTIDVTESGNKQGADSTYVPTNSRGGSKTNTPLIEIPQTINVITAKQISDQGAQSVSQALRYTPGVLAESYGGSSQFDAFTQVRGFKADFYLDGQRLPNGLTSTSWASSVIEPYGLERIDVLKGPASALYGQSTLGGIIDMTSKRPTETPIHEIQVQTGSYDRKQVAVDVGGPVDKDGKLFYRFTGLARDAGTQVDYIGDNRVYVAPALTWKPDLDTSITFLANYLSEWGGKTSFNYMPSAGTVLPNGPYGRIPSNRYMGDPYFDRFDRQQGSIGYLFEHHVNEALTVRQNLRYYEVDADLRALNRSGDMLPGNTTINRRAFGIDAGAKSLAIDNQAEIKYLTGPLAHTVLVGVDYRTENNHYNVGWTPGPQLSLIPPINVYNPVYGLPIPDPGTTNNTLSSTHEQQLGVYAQDQIKYGSWVATIGGRFDDADADTRDGIKNIIGRQRDHAFTGRVGLNYLFDNGVAPYVSYSTAFQPQPGMDFNKNVYKPTTGEQVEVGVKYQPPGTKTLITASVFDITQQNRLTADPDLTHFNNFFQTGEARVRGIEFEARTEIKPGFNLIASYAHLDHEVTKAATPQEVGRRLAQVPLDQASLWALYEFQEGQLNGFGFGGGVRYVGKTWDLTNAFVTPDYTVFDARLQYDFGKLNPQLKGTTLSINALNLFDRYYATQCTSGQGCTLGNRRTILATMSYKW
ncbi:TonB-dependent siderophore receptor [Bradyrhizobium sp. SYSU BS000235]|uniref:TonB-dependent siderophore receptor n=1 Tax=Bradyrhizobium sp. SYSU BS000235 TaxID=3411332 RepID=UPI003C750C8B